MIRQVTMMFVIFFSCAPLLQSGETQSQSVPAEYIRDLKAPGRSNQILRPSAVYVDHQFNEVLVADPGHNRVAIFDTSGVFRFEFSGAGHFSTPVDLAVDKDGFIWVLGTTKEGRKLFVFDFDGLFIRAVQLPPGIDSTGVAYGSFDIGPGGELFLLDKMGFRVIVLDPDGATNRSISLLTSLEEDDRRRQVLGKLRVMRGKILIPCGSLGRVYIYNLDGKQQRSVGYKGTSIGELNFPVAAVLNDDDLLLVLDKHRFNVVCFDLDGQFRGEFGGRGNSPGWFYHPTLLDVDQRGLVYIGQIFQNKVQVCRTPDFILKPNRPGKSDQGNADDTYIYTYSLGWLQSTLHDKGGLEAEEDTKTIYDNTIVSAPEAIVSVYGETCYFWR